MRLFNKLLGKHKIKDYAIIEYDTGCKLRICCALYKGKRDYYDFKNQRVVYGFEVTFARRLSNYIMQNDDKLITDNEAKQFAEENMLWFKHHLKNSEVSKSYHKIYD